MPRIGKGTGAAGREGAEPSSCLPFGGRPSGGFVRQSWRAASGVSTGVSAGDH